MGASCIGAIRHERCTACHTAGDLQYAPPPEEYQERMGDVLASYLASLCTLSRLYGDKDLLEVRVTLLVQCCGTMVRP